MKSNRKTIILIILGILFALSPIFANNQRFTTRDRDITSNYRDEFDHDNLKISAISGKIHIDNNWTDAKDVGICTGNGTYSEPYIIEDFIIDGGGSGSCIKIENSDVYFRIESCTLNNSGEDPDAGIVLVSVANGLLINNEVSNNDGGGIRVSGSSNNKISGNTANNNTYGIALSLSVNNEISRNIGENNWNGVILGHCNNNIISENNVNNNDNIGIGLSNSRNNNISGNVITNNENGGIGFYFSDYNNITGNIVNQNGDVGIQVEHAYFNKIYLNCLNNTLNAAEDGISWNIWDNGIKGNYWADYTGLDEDGDGIGDIPYNISGTAGSQDNFPLMKCPISVQDGGGIPIELIILISIISGGAVIGVATILLLDAKGKE